MKTKKERKQPPVWLLLIVFFTLFFLISIAITVFLNLPWYFPFSCFWGMMIGMILLASGFFILVSALKTLKIKRAFGGELYKSKAESKLITTGIYAYTRNPVYLGSILLFLGWFFIFLFTFLLVMTFLFMILFYFVAKWEEKELYERFGDEYLQYKQKVPLFIPYSKNHIRR